MAGEIKYPNRPAFFAAKAIRAAIKTCVANEHGPSVFNLITVVVMTEDAAHYRRPVTYYNDQLSALIALSDKAFRNTRQRAVESGWLQYIPGGTRRCGKYFVTIPEHATGLDDRPTDEGDIMVDLTANSTVIDDALPVETTANRTAIVPQSYRNRTAIVPPFIPNPNPNPNPKEKDAPPAFPAELDSDDFRTAWQEWLAHRRENRQPALKPRATVAKFKELAEMATEHGVPYVIKAIEHSIAQGWKSIHPKQDFNHGNSRAGNNRNGPGQVFDPGHKPKGGIIGTL